MEKKTYCSLLHSLESKCTWWMQVEAGGLRIKQIFAATLLEKLLPASRIWSQPWWFGRPPATAELSVGLLRQICLPSRFSLPWFARVLVYTGAGHLSHGGLRGKEHVLFGKCYHRRSWITLSSWLANWVFGRELREWVVATVMFWWVKEGRSHSELEACLEREASGTSCTKGIVWGVGSQAGFLSGPTKRCRWDCENMSVLWKDTKPLRSADLLKA